MSPWRWTPERAQGIWKYGPVWLKPFLAAVPWITVGLLLLMFYMIGGAFTVKEGTLFDLPDAGSYDGEATSLVAIVMPMPHETLVFFDDARYTLDDSVSVSAFGGHLQDRLGKTERKTLLVLADRRVSCGNLMKLSAVAKKSGAKKVLFAEKHSEEKFR